MGSFFTIDWAKYVPQLLEGLKWTLVFTVVSFVLAVLWGFALALMRTSSIRVLRGIAYAYTELFRNIPIITEIFIVYYGLGAIGIKLDAFSAGVISLVAFYGAYLSESFRGALQSVSEHQREASVALGFTSTQVIMRVVLPQAVRVALPTTTTYLVDMLKTTSLLVTISASELMTVAQTIASATYRPLEVYVVIGAIYFAMCFPLSRLGIWLERRVAAGLPLTRRRRKLWDEIAERSRELSKPLESDNEIKAGA